VNGKRIADTHEALTLKEAAYPLVQYIPRKGRRHDATATDRSPGRIAPTRAIANYYKHCGPAQERSINAALDLRSSPIRTWSAIREIPGVLYPERVDTHRHRKDHLMSKIIARVAFR